jgi:hypothetical protein
MELARQVVDEKERHAWFADRPAQGQAFDPQLTDEDMAAAREARSRLGGELLYLGTALPSLSDLPDTASIAAIHQDLVRASKLEQEATERRMPLMSTSAPKAVERAEAVLHTIESIIEFLKGTEQAPWLRRIFDIWRHKGVDAPEIAPFNELMHAIERVAQARSTIVSRPVSLPAGMHRNRDLREAVSRAAEGGRPFGLVSFGKSEAKTLLRAIEIQGRAPSSQDDWRRVAVYLAWRDDISAVVARWGARTVAAKSPDFEFLRIQ